MARFGFRKKFLYPNFEGVVRLLKKRKPAIWEVIPHPTYDKVFYLKLDNHFLGQYGLQKTPFELQAVCDDSLPSTLVNPIVRLKATHAMHLWYQPETGEFVKSYQIESGLLSFKRVRKHFSF